MYQDAITIESLIEDVKIYFKSNIEKTNKSANHTINSYKKLESLIIEYLTVCKNNIEFKKSVQNIDDSLKEFIYEDEYLEDDLIAKDKNKIDNMIQALKSLRQLSIHIRNFKSRYFLKKYSYKDFNDELKLTSDIFFIAENNYGIKDFDSIITILNHQSERNIVLLNNKKISLKKVSLEILKQRKMEKELLNQKNKENEIKRTKEQLQRLREEYIVDGINDISMKEHSNKII